MRLGGVGWGFSGGSLGFRGLQWSLGFILGMRVEAMQDPSKLEVATTSPKHFIF